MIDLFFSYAHEDEEMRNQLEIHLSMLKRTGLVRAWHDRRIGAGKDLDREVSQHLESADVVLLLLSPHFLASDYCYETEARRALELHAERKAVVIPIILQPCDWLHSPFQKLRASPRDGKPIAKFPNVNDAFLEVTQDIREAAESLGKGPAPPTVDAVRVAQREPGVRSSNLRLKRTFTDRDRDAFVDDAYAYIEKFFENSLAELSQRNLGTAFRFQKLSPTGFTAAIYVAGSKRTSCHIWLPGKSSFGGDIVYASNDSTATNSINDGVVVDDDGYQLGLKTSGLSLRSPNDSLLTAHGAAEHFWSDFISPLQ